MKRSKEKRARAVPAPIPAPASPSVDEAGVNYFLHHFVVGGQSSSRGYLNYVSAVYAADDGHPALVASMAAVGLAALANSTRQPELSQHAHAKYREAIEHINTALASPVESVKDSTLMSVISLSLVSEQMSKFETWFRHVQGVAALVVSRGKTQFSRPAAILMFNQVRADMAAACIHSHEPFPDDLLELQEEASKHINTSNGFWLLGTLAARCANLLSRVTHNQRVGLDDCLEEATMLQRDFQYVLEIFAREEPYTTTWSRSGDPEIVYNGRVGVYQTSWAIRVWNNSRMLQVVVCEILLHLLNEALATPLTPACRMQMEIKLQETLQILSNLGDNILATIPQALGFVSSVSEPQSSVDLSAASVSGGYLLTWCLYTIGKSPVTDSKTRRWIMRRLQDIGQNGGIAMALQFVEDIDEIDKLARQVQG